MTTFLTPPSGRRASEPITAPRPTRRSRTVFFAVVALVVLGALVVAVLGATSTSTEALAPDSSRPTGAQAAARVLEDQGVRIHRATTTDRAVDLAGAGTTVFITQPRLLDAGQGAALRATGADLVIVDGLFASELDALAPGSEPVPQGGEELLHAQCDDPHASAAERIEGSVSAVRATDPGVEVCFPITADGDAGALATWVDGEQRTYYLADSSLLTNERLAEHGHAALALRMLGGHEDLVWYQPSAYDSGGPAADGASPLPPQATFIGWQLLVLVAVTMLYAGRRLGPVVSEEMPVIVHAAETTRGRGRLYRRSRSHAHAAAALRAGCAQRLADSLGLPPAAGPVTLVPAVARATAREEQDVGALLYGPPPASEADLLALITELDTLESEVHLS